MNNIDLLHPDEQAERHRLIMLDNEELTRVKRAAANRAKGIPEPSVGGKLWVTTSKGIPNRSRAGLRFDAKAKTEVEIVDLVGPELLAKQKTGAAVVSVDGAEQIYEDDSLLVHSDGAVTVDGAAAIARIAEQDALIAQLRADVADARRNAPPDPGDGSSSRLKAAAAAAKARESEFGAPGNTPKSGR